jgi:sporulation protein YlmC with PRC-barrel domain
VITRQQIRTVMADGARVVDSAGQSVGRIVDVVLDVRTSEPAYMTVACGPPPGDAVVVPLTGACLLDGSVQVPYTAADVSGAPPADGAGGGAPGVWTDIRRRSSAATTPAWTTAPPWDRSALPVRPRPLPLSRDRAGRGCR